MKELTSLDFSIHKKQCCCIKIFDLCAKMFSLQNAFFTMLLFSPEDGETLATRKEGQCGSPGGHQDSTHEHTEGSQLTRGWQVGTGNFRQCTCCCQNLMVSLI